MLFLITVGSALCPYESGEPDEGEERYVNSALLINTAHVGCAAIKETQLLKSTFIVRKNFNAAWEEVGFVICYEKSEGSE